MKIQLSEKNGISILAFEGAFDAKTMSAVQAGTKKLFQDGKNRLVFDLEKATGLESGIIREFSILNISARELAGEINLFVPEQNSFKKVESFSHPKSIAVYSALDEAIQAFHESAPTEVEEVSEIESTDLLQAKVEEIKKLKADLQAKEKGELGTLRKENEALKKANQIFEQEILTNFEARSTLPDAAAFQTKIKTLEDRVKQMAEAEAKTAKKE